MSDMPKLLSEMHPNYPKHQPTWEDNGFGFKIVCIPDRTFRARLVDFHKAHPEFANEGVYKFCCPYCGDEKDVEMGGYCCSEVGHCEWVYTEKETV